MIPTMTEDLVREHRQRLLDHASYRSLVRQGKGATAPGGRSTEPQWSMRRALAARLRRVADRLDRRTAHPTIWA
jgi:hypothetical protein